jgi:hypothetical protein
MKYATVEEVVASFTRPVLPTVQGKPDYQTIHATIKFLQPTFGQSTLTWVAAHWDT